MARNSRGFEKIVEDAARARNDEVAPRDFIVEALEMINAGKVTVAKYPSGGPSLLEVNRLALRLLKDGVTKK